VLLSLQGDAFYTFGRDSAAERSRGVDACQRRPLSRRLFGVSSGTRRRAPRAAELQCSGQSHHLLPCDVTDPDVDYDQHDVDFISRENESDDLSS